VAPECGAWTRASGFCSVAKEEKPANPARRAPAYMKERGGEGVKGKQREGGEEEEKGLQYFVIKGVKWGNEKEGGH
jgi:hypothetical protein